VKVVLGLAELALALKFLSSVDLAYHWNLLTREWFVAIWFVLFLTMGLYLLGKLRFSHDSPMEKLGVPRFMFALIALTFSVYLFTGMFGAPLTLIDGIAPPRTHSEDNFRWVNGGLETGLDSDSISVQYAADMHPVGDGSILVFHDLAIGQEYAQKKNLPILLDFTGYACQNCRKTESTVWTNDEIRPLLQKQFVIVSLYVDDRTPLPASEVRVSKLSGKIKTVGNKWATLQTETFHNNAQPFYAVIAADSTLLIPTEDYNPDAEEYGKWLNCGINAHQEWLISRNAE
jgi:thiol:disulfide interchange protein DsbD